MIIYLPLEPLDQRYTTHLDRDISNYLGTLDEKCISLTPSTLGTEIKHGSFLDAPGTIFHKSQQLSMLAEYYNDGIINDGDIIFTSDVWFPGIEAVPYMNYFCNKDVKLRGLLHAGSFTDTDFVRNMERWASLVENAWFDMFEYLYVGSKFMKQDVIKKRLVSPDKIKVTGFPLDINGLEPYLGREKEDIVIFNGRNVDEKQPWLFDELRNKMVGQAKFVNTQKEGLSKSEYYDLISRAKVVVSFALQENFGFGILECVHLGCIPVVPDRLVYPEMFSKQYRYTHFEQCCELVVKALNNDMSVPLVNTYQDSVKEWFKR